MHNDKFLPFYRPTLLLAATILLAAGFGFGQIDPNPNSPTPVLFSKDDTTRVLAEFADSGNNKLRPDVFPHNSKIRFFIGDLTLIPGEGPDSIRCYAEDAKGRVFRFPVIELMPVVENGTTIHAVTVLLRDELGFWPHPTDGDVAVRISWRGLTSNRLLLALGKSGGFEIRPSDIIPSPVSSREIRPGDTKALEDLSYVGYRWSGDRRRFLEQAAFGPTDALDQRIRRIGIRTWLAEQFEAPYPSTGTPYPNIPLRSTDSGHVTLGCGMFVSGTPENRNCTRTHYNMYPVQNWFFTEAFYGDAQLRHRVAWALSQMWVISGSTTQQSSWMIAYHKILSENAFGNYRALMKEMTLNPGMGNYLDMRRSTRNNPNENYPRELLQLFTVGTYLLNQNGTPIMQNGEPVPTYDQETVNNFTKVFTGWRLCTDVNVCPNTVVDIPNYKDPMALAGNNHNLEAKTLFSYPGSTTTNIPACTGCTGTAREDYANASLDQAMDNIFNHPNVAPHVSKFLIQHLVMSDPSPAYVARVSAVFNNNGSNVRGDLKAVIRAILLDPEARGDVKTDPAYGKLREPVQMITNIARHFNVRGANETPISDGVVNGLSNTLGQNTFYSPSVFNYYPPGYVVPGGALPGPEFALMNTGTSIGRANLVNTLVFSQIGTSETVPLGTSLDLSEMIALATEDATGALLVDALDRKMLHNTMSTQMRASITTAVTAIPASNSIQRARQAVYLVASSSQFQIQR